MLIIIAIKIIIIMIISSLCEALSFIISPSTYTEKKSQDSCSDVQVFGVTLSESKYRTGFEEFFFR